VIIQLNGGFLIWIPIVKKGSPPLKKKPHMENPDILFCSMDGTIFVEFDE